MSTDDETPEDQAPRATAEPSDEQGAPEAEEIEVPALTALLKRSLVKSDDLLPSPEKDAALLASVQRKLRKRSKGKFYGDGWSTTHSRFSYALVASMMLVTIVAVYLALGPTAFSIR